MPWPVKHPERLRRGGGTVTYDRERQMQGAKLLKMSEFAEAIIQHMGE